MVLKNSKRKIYKYFYWIKFEEANESFNALFI